MVAVRVLGSRGQSGVELFFEGAPARNVGDEEVPGIAADVQVTVNKNAMLRGEGGFQDPAYGANRGQYHHRVHKPLARDFQRGFVGGAGNG